MMNVSFNLKFFSVGCPFRQPIHIFLLTLFFGLKAFSQEKLTVSGTIVDENKKAVCFATVFEENTNQQCLSNENGSFSFEINPIKEDSTIHLFVKAFGYEKTELTLPAAQDSLNELKIELFNVVLNLPEVTASSHSPEIRPLLKSVRKSLKDNYYPDAYLSEYICEQIFMQNKNVIVNHFHSHGNVLLPENIYKGNPNFSVELKSIYTNKNIDKRKVVAVDDVTYSLQKAFDFFNFLDELYSSNNYTFQYSGIRKIDSIPCYHIKYSPISTVNIDKNRHFTGYFAIDTNTHALVQFEKLFRLNENQEETQFKYNLGPAAVLFGVKGSWCEENVFASFKLHENKFVLNHVNYLQKIYIVYKTGGYEYAGTQKDIKCLRVCESKEMENFVATSPEGIPADSLPNYEDPIFWKNYFKLSKVKDDF